MTHTDYEFQQLSYHLLQQRGVHLAEANPKLARLLLVPERNVVDKIKTYAKIYPYMTKYYVYDRARVVRKRGFEDKLPLDNTARSPKNAIQSAQADISSVRRTKTRISDIILSNQFDLFCTFTFAKNREDIPLLKKQMSRWLENQQVRSGRFDYIIIPEFHKKCGSCADAHKPTCPHDDVIKPIHFHALFKGYKGKMVFSGKFRKDGRQVFNLTGYTLGYSTATKIDYAGVPLVSSYVRKYITKDMPHFPGQRRYWVSQGLQRPKKVANPVIFPTDYEKLGTPYRARGISIFQSDEPIDFVPAY